jgi:glutathione S-transferase
MDHETVIALKLYFAPGSCSRATLIALEETGVPYEAQAVAFMHYEQGSPEYLALNPKGKVPLLLADGKPITETVAIMGWLAETYPEAKLLPRTETPYDQAQIIGDLAWVSSALHALIARLRFPMMFTDKPEAYEGVFTMASAAMARNFSIIETRLAGRDWWHGDWSVQDAYLYWVWTRAADAGFDAAPYKNFNAHVARMTARPSVQRALARETQGDAELAKRGAAFTIPAFKSGAA